MVAVMQEGLPEWQKDHSYYHSRRLNDTQSINLTTQWTWYKKKEWSLKRTALTGAWPCTAYSCSDYCQYAALLCLSHWDQMSRQTEMQSQCNKLLPDGQEARTKEEKIFCSKRSGTIFVPPNVDTVSRTSLWQNSILFCARLCLSTVGCNPLSESSNFLCPSPNCSLLPHYVISPMTFWSSSSSYALYLPLCVSNSPSTVFHSGSVSSPFHFPLVMCRTESVNLFFYLMIVLQNLSFRLIFSIFLSMAHWPVSSLVSLLILS